MHESNNLNFDSEDETIQEPLFMKSCLSYKSEELPLVKITNIGDENDENSTLKSDKKVTFIKKFNCFKTFQKMSKQKKHASFKRNNKVYPNSIEKCKVLFEDIKNKKNKMNFPIKKESENLLFVATKYATKYLLGPVNLDDKNKKCCVIDLDETLVHSSFKPLARYDFKVNVDIEGAHYDIFIIKRPYVDLFLNKMGKLFECVLFTASLAKYANLVANSLDRGNVFKWRLYREACIYYRGGFVKDLSMLGRPIDQTVILDNSPMSFLFNSKNAIHIISWFDDPDDKALLDIIPFCEKLANATSVLKFLQAEQPPITSAWPMRNTFPFPQNLSTSKQSSSDSIQLKSDLNPISGLNSSLTLNKKPIANFYRNYSEKGKSQSFTPSIRSFFSKTLGKNSNDIDKESYASTSDSKNVSIGNIEYFKNTLSRSSLSSIGVITKDSSIRNSIQNLLSPSVNVAETIKIEPQTVYVKEEQ